MLTAKLKLFRYFYVYCKCLSDNLSCRKWCFYYSIIVHLRQTIESYPLLTYITVRQPLLGASCNVVVRCIKKNITSHDPRIIIISDYSFNVFFQNDAFDLLIVLCNFSFGGLLDYVSNYDVQSSLNFSHYALYFRFIHNRSSNLDKNVYIT